MLSAFFDLGQADAIKFITMEYIEAESAADRTATLALVQLTLGKTKDAVSSADKASSSSKDPGVSYRAAQVYIAAGQEAKAF
jgi:hypothetical protein